MNPHINLIILLLKGVGDHVGLPRHCFNSVIGGAGGLHTRVPLAKRLCYKAAIRISHSAQRRYGASRAGFGRGATPHSSHKEAERGQQHKTQLEAKR